MPTILQLSWIFGVSSWYAGGRFGRTYLVTPRAGGCRVTQHARSGKCTRAEDARSVREGKRLAESWED
jgi:hypothetical protein